MVSQKQIYVIELFTGSTELVLKKELSGQMRTLRDKSTISNMRGHIGASLQVICHKTSDTF